MQQHDVLLYQHTSTVTSELSCIHNSLNKKTKFISILNLVFSFSKQE